MENSKSFLLNVASTWKISCLAMVVAIGFAATGCSGCREPLEPETITEASTQPTTQPSTETPSTVNASEPKSSEPKASVPEEAPRKSPASDARPSDVRPSGAESGSTQSASAAADLDVEELTAGQAARRAEALQKRARQLADDNPGAAFQAALQGWQLVSQHPGDAACDQLAADLQSLLSPLSQRANAAGLGESRRIPPTKKTAIE